jgi:hypothetical protein
MKRIIAPLLALAACNFQLTTRTGHSTSTQPQPQPQSQSQPQPQPQPQSSRFEPQHSVARVQPVDDRAYQACVAAFDANYDAWLPTDRAAKATLAKVKDQSPYLAVPALLEAYAQVDLKAAPRQTGAVPAGAKYAAATRMELATALVQIAVATHASSCVDNQFRAEVDHEYLPPLVGDRERDKLIQCGGSGAEARKAWADARSVMVETFNTANATLHDDHSTGGWWSQLAAFSSNAKESTLSLTTLTGNRECVNNGRYGKQADGSWGPLCDWHELPSSTVGNAQVYHLAPRDVPFKVKRGDHVVVAYELDPNAPASEDKVARRGGWWWFTSVSRGDKTIFANCATASAHEVEVLSPLRELVVRTR